MFYLVNIIDKEYCIFGKKLLTTFSLVSLVQKNFSKIVITYKLCISKIIKVIKAPFINKHIYYNNIH